MVTPTARAIVLVSFPFSDLSSSKLRPAVVIAYADRDDWILCQITSNSYGDDQAIVVDDSSFTSGSLHVTSYVRPGKLFTANSSIIKTQVGVLNEDTFNKIVDRIVNIVQSSVKPETT